MVLIRPATPGDATAIAALRAQSWQAAYPGIIPAEVLPVPPGPEAGQPARTELYAIYVAPAHWSSGAGRALLAEELERARAAGSGWISLWVLEDNARASRFYERSGFADTGKRLVSPEPGGVVQVRYERPVS